MVKRNKIATTPTLRNLLIGALALVVLAGPAVGLQTPQPNAYRVVSQLARRVKAVLAKTITLDETVSGTMLVYALIPPDTETQRLVSCTVACREAPGLAMATAKDKNNPQRQYRLIDIPVTETTRGRPFHVDITYVVELYRVGLLPTSGEDIPIPRRNNARAHQRGKRTSAPSAVPAAADGAATKALDYKDPLFQAFLGANDLRRRARENNLFFAYRAFRSLSADLAKRTRPDAPAVDPANWKASYLCRRDVRDAACGLCSIQLAAILRANGIPARLLVGRWAKNNEGTYGQFHVRVDFFDAAVGGWVPIDPTFGLLAVRDGNDPDINFGANNGDFITMHLNSEVSPEGSNFEMPLHQFEVLAFRGNGPFRPEITESWMVSDAR